ncbi:MAG: hypothetical protein U1F61_17105 [Opitutaceae bacterium]
MVFSTVRKTVNAELTTEGRSVGIARVLVELASDYDRGWVTLECQASNQVVEVAFDDPHFVLNIPHTESQGLLPRLLQVGIAIPTGWVVKKDKKKTLLSMGFLEVEVQKHQRDELAEFIRLLARDLLAWPERQSIVASFQR